MGFPERFALRRTRRGAGLAAAGPLGAPPAPPLGAFEMADIADLGATADFRRDPAGSLMAVLFGALGVFLVAGLCFGTFAKQETMRGYVTAAGGAARLTATVPGTVRHVWVTQGQVVKAGQRLVTIAPQQSSAGGSSFAESDLAAMQAARTGMIAEMERLSSLLDRDAGDRTVFETDEQSLAETLRAQEQRLDGAIALQEKAVEKFHRYLGLGYATREQAMGEESRLLDLGRQLADTRIRIRELSTTGTERRRTLERTATEVRNSYSALQTQLKDADAKLERFKAAFATDILAPSDGQVAALNVVEGGIVETGDVVAALADPGASLRIALEAQSKAIGLVQPGQRVVLKYDAFPYKTFGIQYGRVLRVGEAPLELPKSFDPSKSMNPLAPAQSTFLIEVEPERTTMRAYGEERPIVIGSTLSADVVVERRRLIEWVLDPILAMRGRL